MYNSGTFTLSGGTINGNYANKASYGYGGGVYNTGTFELESGTITGNTAKLYGGGVYNTGTFTISNGEISKNTNSSSYGGGVYNSGTFTMLNGAISENTSTYAGGVYNSGAFEMKSGKITGNSARYYGGGVYSCMMTGFTATGGVISGNTACAGGGIYVNAGAVTLTNTVITNNTATTNGAGGIQLVSGSTLDFVSGALYGNTGLWGIMKGTLDFSASASAYSLMAAHEMSDLAAGAPVFGGIKNAQNPYVWVDTDSNEYQGVVSAEDDIMLSAQVSGEDFEVSVKDLAEAKNIATGVEYESFKDALEYANDGDTIELISTADDGLTVGIYSAEIDKKITIQLDAALVYDENESTYKCESQYLICLDEDTDVLFTVTAGGSLTLAGPSKIGASAMAVPTVAELSGTIVVDGGSLTMDTSVVPYSESANITVDLQQGDFTINGYIPWRMNLQRDQIPLKVKLAEGQAITAGENFGMQNDSGGIAIELPETVTEAIKSGDAVDVTLIRNCEDTDVLKDIWDRLKENFIGSLVTAEVSDNGEIVLKTIELVADAVYLDVKYGKADNTGESDNNAVNDLKQAIALAKVTNSKTIYVMNEITLTGVWDGEGVTLLRYPGYTGKLASASGTLTLTNITLDGGTGSDNASLLSVPYGTTAILGYGAVLQNNDITGNASSNHYLRYGGGANVSGTLIMEIGSKIQNCKAEVGGGVALLGNTSSMTMNGGEILHNESLKEGGGIAIPQAFSTTKVRHVLDVLNGTISGNTAGTAGGGIYVECANSITIGSNAEGYTGKVYITNNVATGTSWEHPGGGLYVNGDPDCVNGMVQLYDVVITGNETNGFGSSMSENVSSIGGLSGCPTSNVQIYLTNGGAIYGNTSDGVHSDVALTSPRWVGTAGLLPILCFHPSCWAAGLTTGDTVKPIEVCPWMNLRRWIIEGPSTSGAILLRRPRITPITRPMFLSWATALPTATAAESAPTAMSLSAPSRNPNPGPPTSTWRSPGATATTRTMRTRSRF